MRFRHDIRFEFVWQILNNNKIKRTFDAYIREQRVVTGAKSLNDAIKKLDKYVDKLNKQDSIDEEDINEGK